MTMYRIFLSIAVLVMPLFAQAQSGSQAAAEQDSLRILWVGNSFTYYNDLPAMVQRIAQTQKIKLSYAKITKGGERWSGHLKNRKLLDTLARGGWDYVVLQEQSTIPALQTEKVAREVYPAARELDSLIHAASPDAHVVFYMTWGHKYGNRKHIDDYPPANTYEGMQERLTTSYLEMTYANDAWCAPVGMAWRRVRRERPALQLYKQDCFHPSTVGSYLAANVFFATLFGRRYQTDYTAGIDAETAEYLQQAAQQTVFDNRELLNLPQSR